MSYDDLGFFDVTVDQGIALIRLNRPESGNAYTADDHRQMSEIYTRIAADEDVNVGVVTGAGNVFSIGPDREFATALNADAAVAAKGMAEARRMIMAAYECTKPLVAAINGRIVGGALSFVLCTDIVIADRGVSLRDIHIPAAITSGDGAVLLWPLAMGLLRAKRYMLTGDPLSAERAEQYGLITEAVEPGTALERAMVYARRFAAGPQQALRTTKRAMNQLILQSPRGAFELSMALEEATIRDPEAVAAMADLVAGGQGAMPPDDPPAPV